MKCACTRPARGASAKNQRGDLPDVMLGHPKPLGCASPSMSGSDLPRGCNLRTGCTNGFRPGDKTADGSTPRVGPLDPVACPLDPFRVGGDGALTFPWVSPTAVHV